MDAQDYFNVKTCQRCGALYETFLEINYCPSCYQLLEEKLEEVRHFTKANPEATLEEIEVALKVDKKQLQTWMQESRLKMSEASGAAIPCQNCRTPIRYGKYCPLCRADLVDKLESVYDPREDKKQGVVLKSERFAKMHYMDRRNKKR